MGKMIQCGRTGKSNSDVPKSLKSFPLKQSVNIFHKIFMKWYMIFIKEHQHIFIQRTWKFSILDLAEKGNLSFKVRCILLHNFLDMLGFY